MSRRIGITSPLSTNVDKDKGSDKEPIVWKSKGHQRDGGGRRTRGCVTCDRPQLVFILTANNNNKYK